MRKVEEKRAISHGRFQMRFGRQSRRTFRKRNGIPKKHTKMHPVSRKPMPARKALEGIFYVLRTSCQWKAIPRKYGSGSTIHRTFQEWQKAGFFEKIWAKGLEKYDELEGIGWEWQSLDGCMVKAPLAQESVGKNPTDRGKMGTKTQCTDR